MFKYKLEPLLRYRKLLEEKQQRSLAAASRHYNDKLKLVHDMERMRVDAQKGLTENLTKIKDTATLRLYYAFFAGASIIIHERQQDADAILQFVDIERLKLIDSIKSRKTIEVHKDHMKERYEKEEDKKERAMYDEVALTRFAYQAKEKERIENEA